MPRWWRHLATVLATCVLLAAPSAAVAGPEWRSLTGGIGWRACQTIELRPNLAFLYTAELQRAVDDINAAIGAPAPVLSVGAPTALTGKNFGDGQSVVFLTDLPGSVAGTAYISWTTNSSGPVEVVAGDVAIDAPIFLGMTSDARTAVLVHELGHFLGLAHVGDAHEALSNGFIYDGDIGPGTTEALRRLYDHGACTVGDLGDGPDGHTWNLPNAAGYGGVVTSVNRWHVGSSASSVIDLGVQLAAASTSERGNHWAQLAVVCRDDLFADCLAGAALAGAYGPIVFVPGGEGGALPNPVLSVLAQSLPPSGTVYVLGGDKAVSAGVEQALRTHWPDTRRLSGPSRIETAVEVARTVVARNGSTGTVVVAREDNPADAVTGGAAAGARGLPILMTPKSGLHGATAAALAEFGATRTLMLGGNGALEPAVEAALAAAGRGPERVAGRTRTETSVAVAQHPSLWDRTSIPSESTFVGLNGYHDDTWALALSVAPLAAHRQAPVLLTNHADVPISAPGGGGPGEPGWYLSHLPIASGGASLTYIFVGVGRWADRHAAESFRSYVMLGS